LTRRRRYISLSWPSWSFSSTVWVLTLVLVSALLGSAWFLSRPPNAAPHVSPFLSWSFPSTVWVPTLVKFYPARIRINLPKPPNAASPLYVQLILRQCSLGAKTDVILPCWDLHKSPKPFNKFYLMPYRRYIDLIAISRHSSQPASLWSIIAEMSMPAYVHEARLIFLSYGDVLAWPNSARYLVKQKH
jgi:hypothetical protein